MAKELKEMNELSSTENKTLPIADMAGFDSSDDKKKYVKIVAMAVAAGSQKGLAALMSAGCAKEFVWNDLAKPMGKAIKGDSPDMLGLLWRQAMIAGIGEPEWMDLLAQCARQSMKMLAWAVEMAKNSGVEAPKNASRALVEAAQRGDREIVDYLLAQGADPSSNDSLGTTALMAAAESGDASVVDLLLKAGANPLAANKDGDSVALYAATGKGSLDVLAKVLAVGGMGSPDQGAEALVGLISVDREFPDSTKCGDSKIQWEMGKALLDAGALHYRSPGWDGPLLWAVHKENASMVRLLLGAGADPSVLSQEGQDALAFAMEQDLEEIALELLRAGAPWRRHKLVDGDKVSLLKFAREQDWTEVVDWLESNREARSIELAIKGTMPMAAKSLVRL